MNAAHCVARGRVGNQLAELGSPANVPVGAIWPTEAEQFLRSFAAERPDNLAEWRNLSFMFQVHGQLGTLAARQGNRAEAERISAVLEALPHAYLFGEHTCWRARIAVLLGEREEAVALLRAAYAQGFKWWLPLHNEPDFESLRDYPPFRELLRPKG